MNFPVYNRPMLDFSPNTSTFLHYPKLINIGIQRHHYLIPIIHAKRHHQTRRIDFKILFHPMKVIGSNSILITTISFCQCAISHRDVVISQLIERNFLHETRNQFLKELGTLSWPHEIMIGSCELVVEVRFLVELSQG